MTKSCYEALVAQYGEKICGISLDNGRIIYVGYRQKDWHGKPIPNGQPKGPTLADITVETIGDSDCLVVREKMQSQGSVILKLPIIRLTMCKQFKFVILKDICWIQP